MFEYKPIYWHQGLYLQPQHLQNSDLYHSYWQGRYMQLGQPCCWGIIHFSLNQAALKSGELKANIASFLFADGSYADCEKNAVLSTRCFTEAWKNKNAPFTLYVGLHKLETTLNNVTLVTEEESTTITTRWISQADNKPEQDLYGKGLPAEIQRLTYHLSFFFEDEIETAHGYTLLPVGRLSYIDQEIVIDTHYIPPCLFLYSVKNLGNWVDDCYHILLSRLQQFEELKRAKALETDVFTQEKSTLLLASQILSRYIMELHHYRQLRDVHPEKLVLLLKQLFAELCSFTHQYRFTDVIDSKQKKYYQHEEIAITLTDIKKKIVSALNALLIEENRLVTLSFLSNYYTAEIDFLLKENRAIYLILRSAKITPAYIIDNSLMKLASKEDIDYLIQHSLPGIELSYQTVPPAGLPNKSTTFYLQLNQKGELWDSIKKMQSVAFYIPQAPDDLHVELVIMGEN